MRPVKDRIVNEIVDQLRYRVQNQVSDYVWINLGYQITLPIRRRVDFQSWTKIWTLTYNQIRRQPK